MKRKIAAILMVVVLSVILGLIPVTSAGATTGLPELVGLWHFDEGEGTDAFDSSGNANDGTLKGGFGYALSFDGTDDYVEIGDSAALDITGPITLEAWVKFAPAAMGKDSVIARKGNAYSLQKYTNDQLEGWVKISGAWKGVRTVSGGTILIANTWYHVAFTYDGNNVTTFVNGVADRTGAVNGSIDATAKDAWFGLDRELGFPRAETAGIIDEVRISNIERTSFNLFSPYAVDANTVALWHFDEGSGQKAYDSAGGHHGQLGSTSGSDPNDPIWVSSDIEAGPEALPQWTSGKYDGGLSFEGNNGYVDCGDISNQDWSGLTTEAWVWWNGDTVRGYAGVYHKAYNNDIGRLLINPAGKVLVQNGNENFFSDNNGDVPTNQWCHIAYVYDQSASMEYIYVNGVKKGEKARSGDIAQNSADFWIGYGWHASTFYVFSGLIDEVRIWNGALTAEQIALFYSGSVNWLPPVTNADFVLQDGTTLPLKFQIFNDSGLVTTMQPVSLEISGPEGFTRTYVLGDGVENLRWNADSSSYIVNLKTKDGSWPGGEYIAKVDYDEIAFPFWPDSTTFELSPDKGTGRGNSGK